MSDQPIENYGVVGNMRTVALVGLDGSIDWLCYRHFDSPSVFGAMLDTDKGGRFRIAPPSDGVACRQFYWPDTNVLVTRFLSPDGVGQIIDFMPVDGGEPGSEPNALVRYVHVVRGRMRFRVDCAPAFDYAREAHDTQLVEGGAVFRSPKLSLGLATTAPLEPP